MLYDNEVFDEVEAEIDKFAKLFRRSTKLMVVCGAVCKREGGWESKPEVARGVRDIDTLPDYLARDCLIGIAVRDNSIVKSMPKDDAWCWMVFAMGGSQHSRYPNGALRRTTSWNGLSRGTSTDAHH